MGLTAAQVVHRLSTWNCVMQEKVIVLHKGAVFYRIANYFAKVSTGVLAVIMIGLESALIGAPGAGTSTIRTVAIVLLVLQAVQTFIQVSDAVVSPATKSNGCIVSAKQYDQLSREISLKIDEYSNNTFSNASREKYLFETLNYSTREQLLLEAEPLLVFFSSNTRLPPTPEHIANEPTDDIARLNLIQLVLYCSDGEVTKLSEYLTSSV
jgi:hypothetical protein